MEIINVLINGDIGSLEEVAQLVDGFPHQQDKCINRYWITNAIDCGSYESISWIMSKNVDLQFRDDEGYTVLHSCIDRDKSDRCKVMELLLDNGANIDMKGINDWTPLHMAAMRGHLDLVQCLLIRGAKTNIKTDIDDFATAEEECRRCGRISMADFIANFSKNDTGMA